MRKVFILEQVIDPRYGQCWVLTLPRNHWIERAVMRYTRWPVEQARLGTDTVSYSMIFLFQRG